MANSVKKFAKIACECIGKEMRKLSIDANLYKFNVDRGPHFENAHKKYVELAEAYAFFEQMQSGGTGLPLFDGKP